MLGEYYRRASRDVRIRNSVHAVGVIVAAFVLGLVLAVVGANVIALVTGKSPEQLPVTYNVVLAILQYVGFFAAALWYIANVSGRDLVAWRMPTLRDLGWIVGGFFGLVAAAYAVAFVISVLGLSSATNQVITTGRDHPRYFLYMIPIALLLVGPGEELVFRGLVQGLLKRAFGAVPAILAASALFGVAHYLALVGTTGGKITAIAIAGTLGLVLGVVYEYADNVVVPAVIHGAWNAMLFVLNWYIVVYGIELPA